MALSDLPGKPPVNGNAVEQWLVGHVQAIKDELIRQKKPWYLDWTIGHVVTLGTILVALLFAYFRGEAHIADAAHVHWTAADLDREIDRQDSLTMKPTDMRLASVETQLGEIRRAITSAEARMYSQTERLMGGQERTRQLIRDSRLPDGP